MHPFIGQIHHLSLPCTPMYKLHPSFAHLSLRVSSDYEFSPAARAIDLNSDLVKGIYEGGLKTWESSLDLLNYIANLGISWNDKKVMEIGCGSGLPAVFCLRQGAEVVFQDYVSTIAIYGVLFFFSLVIVKLCYN